MYAVVSYHAKSMKCGCELMCCGCNTKSGCQQRMTNSEINGNI